MTSTDDTTATELSTDRLQALAGMLRSERSELLATASGTELMEVDPTDDPGTRLSERDALATISNLQAAQLEQVDAALARIESGTYGACADCGATIPLERLEIVPSATYCVQCQGRHAG